MKDKKNRQYRSRQGRTDKSYSDSMTALMIAYLGIIILIAITSI
tara:strand:+ start:590 stop:721 length:132 start_codon:yes stop_codon:yes gene_type:complete